jgi:hypothetical protein
VLCQANPLHSVAHVRTQKPYAGLIRTFVALENSLGAGDTPIGDIVGPNYYQWDLSLRKTFNLPFREGTRLQFQADAFNVFNRTNWNNPVVNNAGTSSFGQITGALPARVLQFGGKFSF